MRPAEDSAEQQDRSPNQTHHFGCRAADEEAADTRVAVSAHYQKVDVIGFGMSRDDLFRLAILDMNLDCVSSAPQHIGSGFELASRFWRVATRGHEMTLKACKQLPSGNVIDGLHHARAAIEGDKEAIDRLKCS